MMTTSDASEFMDREMLPEKSKVLLEGQTPESGDLRNPNDPAVR